VAASSRDEDFGPRIREVKISGEKIMARNTTECGYCRFSIAQGQRWVREKVYAYTSQNGHEPIYQRYHAEVFAGETLSCWEKHQMDQETARISRTALRAA
jgi:hypothetical protein